MVEATSENHFPPAAEHAAKICLIHVFVCSNPVMKEYNNDKVKQYFDMFERKCREGLFEDMNDVSTFFSIGTDQNGLTIWIRMKGSSHCKNVHQR